jgi:hypothetical protein
VELIVHAGALAVAAGDAGGKATSTSTATQVCAKERTVDRYQRLRLERRPVGSLIAHLLY